VVRGSAQRMGWLSGAAMAAGLIASGCTVSPQPEPPLDLGRITLAESDGGVVLRGARGSAAPGGTLSVLHLDGSSPAARVRVGADGSFHASLAGALFDEYRLQLSSDGARSAPIDVTGVAGLAAAPVALANRPLSGCLRFDPDAELEGVSPGESATVTLTNACGGPVILGSFALRLGSAWSVEAAPLTVDEAAEAAFRVRFDPAGVEPHDDVLFIGIAAPEAGRRALSLVGRGQ
jgi:hypothetical protein